MAGSSSQLEECVGDLQHEDVGVAVVLRAIPAESACCSMKRRSLAPHMHDQHALYRPPHAIVFIVVL